MKRNYLLTVLSLIPLIVWLSMKPFYERFGTADAVLSSFSQIAALTGTMLFALYLIATSNNKTVASFFNDANNLRKRMSQASFLLLMTHPLLLLVEFVSHSSNVLSDKAGWALDFGIYAAVLLIALFVSELFAKQKHQVLQSAPVAMTSILFLGTLHAFFIPSSLSENTFIKFYILVFVSIAILLQVHKVVLILKTRKMSQTEAYSLSK